MPKIVAAAKTTGLIFRVKTGRRVYSVCHAKTNAQRTNPQSKNSASAYHTETGRFSHNSIRGSDDRALKDAAMAEARTTGG